jgi:hypothetical protein
MDAKEVFFVNDEAEVGVVAMDDWEECAKGVPDLVAVNRVIPELSESSDVTESPR